jgi:D-3-phosphoglycerate dehydrogenase
MKKVLITVTIFQNEEYTPARKWLESHGCQMLFNTTGRNLTHEEFLEKIADVDAVILGGERIDEYALQAAKNLKIVCRHGVGYDNVNVSKAREHGVVVTNTPVPELATGVAELAMGMLLGMLRNVTELSSSLRAGKWESREQHLLLRKSVGLVGFGRIAQEFARMLGAFGVSLSAYDVKPDNRAAKKLNVEMTTFERVLSGSDIVSVHVPSTAQTRHLFDEKAFSLMKDGSYFLNTARGAVVDESALYKSLTNGKLRAAATDVFEKEPTDPTNPLLGLNNLIGLPHIAGGAVETAAAIGMDTARIVVDALEGRKPRNILTQ